MKEDISPWWWLTFINTAQIDGLSFLRSDWRLHSLGLNQESFSPGLGPLAPAGATAGEDKDSAELQRRALHSWSSQLAN